MANQNAVTREEWLVARKEHLVKEKEFTRLRDELSKQRRNLPWVKVDKEYVFEGLNGKESLAGLFAGRSQLLVYHFMFGPDWEEGCPSCSFWADNYDGIIQHLSHHDNHVYCYQRYQHHVHDQFLLKIGLDDNLTASRFHDKPLGPVFWWINYTISRVRGYKVALKNPCS